MELYDETPPDLPDISKIGSFGWAALCAGVVAFDFLAKETLSEACKRGLDNDRTRPFVLGAIALTGTHLCGVLPTRVDPFKYLVRLKRTSS